MSRRLTLSLAALVVALSPALISAAVKFSSVYKSLEASSVSFANKKVAALVISEDDSLRQSAEEAMVRELNARGMVGVASYRIAPKEELRRADTAKPWFERAGIEGVVAIRPVSAETKDRYNPGMWVSGNYSTLWNYYGYGWSSVYIPGSYERETSVIVETTVYSASRNELVWAAVSETKNPKTLQKYIEELVKESVKMMQKQGLAKMQVK